MGVVDGAAIRGGGVLLKGAVLDVAGCCAPEHRAAVGRVVAREDRLCYVTAGVLRFERQNQAVLPYAILTAGCTVSKDQDQEQPQVLLISSQMVTSWACNL